MNYWIRGIFLVMGLFVLALPSCGKIKPPNYPNNFTKTPTLTRTYTSSPTVTLTGSPTTTKSPTPLFSATPTQTRTSTFTSTVTSPPPPATPTATNSRTPSPTGTWFTPTQTPFNTGTPCRTATSTTTMVLTPTATNPASVTGIVTYNGSGTVDINHPIYVGVTSLYTNKWTVSTNGGNYSFFGGSPAVYPLVAFYDFKGLSASAGINSGISWSWRPLPGMRYTNTGVCSDPVVLGTYPVTVTGGANAGPNITIDDTCSYWGVYGTLAYTGTRGIPGICRVIHLQTYLDPGFSTPAPYNASGPGFYSFVTNDGPSSTGLAPLYIRVWFDANGSSTFNSGDPYLDFGQVTPTTDGLLQNITFGDTFIK